MIKPGALGGKDASFPLGGMLQAPHGLQGLCGGGTDWLLAGSLGRRVELSTQFQEDRLSRLWLLLLWVGWIRAGAIRTFPVLCTSPLLVLWLEKAHFHLFSHSFIVFFATPAGIYGLLAFSVPSQGFMQEKAGTSQPFALCPMLICSSLYLLVS